MDPNNSFFIPGIPAFGQFPISWIPAPVPLNYSPDWFIHQPSQLSLGYNPLHHMYLQQQQVRQDNRQEPQHPPQSIQFVDHQFHNQQQFNQQPVSHQQCSCHHQYHSNMPHQIPQMIHGPFQYQASFLPNHMSNPAPTIMQRQDGPQAPPLSIKADTPYMYCSKIILTEEQLREHGFVRIDQAGNFVVSVKNKKWSCWADAGSTSRLCARCRAPFDLAKAPSECHFHLYGKVCKQSMKPCAVAAEHVHNATDRTELRSFAPTPKTLGPNDTRNTTVLAIDTEMVYTVKGLEVARATLVNEKGGVVLDVYIKPTSRIVDYNTQFSGIEKGSLVNSISLESARQNLFNIVNENTIIVGHHLSNDLKALKIIHSRVVDTAVLFQKDNKFFSLKELAKMVLHKTIQDVHEGHNSALDAQITMELVLNQNSLTF